MQMILRPTLLPRILLIPPGRNPGQREFLLVVAKRNY
jgi:hypothetical protein|tara:strand:+ start:479 stop:589 length:111 start_codon:yes stop_codon:yes gene_type:complete